MTAAKNAVITIDFTFVVFCAFMIFTPFGFPHYRVEMDCFKYPVLKYFGSPVVENLCGQDEHEFTNCSFIFKKRFMNCA